MLMMKILRLFVLAICHEIILEGEEGQDAVYCEGQCQSWIHRKCSGLTSQVFEQICESEDKYLCPFCALSVQNCELVELRKLVKSLSEKVEKLSGNPPTNTTMMKNTANTAESPTNINPSSPPADITATLTSLMNEEREKDKRKLNVIVHNLPECA